MPRVENYSTLGNMGVLMWTYTVRVVVTPHLVMLVPAWHYAAWFAKQKLAHERYRVGSRKHGQPHVALPSELDTT